MKLTKKELLFLAKMQEKLNQHTELTEKEIIFLSALMKKRKQK